MKNADIIFTQAQELMKAGIIGKTGRTSTAKVVNADGEEEEIIVEEAEPIHTYAKWKELGFQVQKGEKAVAHSQYGNTLPRKPRKRARKTNRKCSSKRHHGSSCHR